MPQGGHGLGAENGVEEFAQHAQQEQALWREVQQDLSYEVSAGRWMTNQISPATKSRSHWGRRISRDLLQPPRAGHVSSPV